jgi:alkyl hydroperoxide reductase subunit AhpC
MSLRINDIAPDFIAETIEGTLHIHDWIGDGWAVLFSHPKGFTPVCTTELGAVAGLEKQFAQRGAKVIGLSVDPVESHSKWKQDIEDVGGHKVNYPLIGDPTLTIAKRYDMLPGETSAGRTPANNAPARTVFVIGPDKRIKLQIAYPMTTGRNFDEVIACSIPSNSPPNTRSQRRPTGSKARTSSSPPPYPMTMRIRSFPATKR